MNCLLLWLLQVISWGLTSAYVCTGSPLLLEAVNCLKAMAEAAQPKGRPRSMQGVPEVESSAQREASARQKKTSIVAMEKGLNLSRVKAGTSGADL